MAEVVAHGDRWTQPPDGDPVWRDFWVARSERAERGLPPVEHDGDVPPAMESYAALVLSGRAIGLTFEGFAAPGLVTIVDVVTANRTAVGDPGPLSG